MIINIGVWCILLGAYLFLDKGYLHGDTERPADHFLCFKLRKIQNMQHSAPFCDLQNTQHSLKRCEILPWLRLQALVVLGLLLVAILMLMQTIVH